MTINVSTENFQYVIRQNIYLSLRFLKKILSNIMEENYNEEG